jgi:hypothetical protein
MPQWQAQGHRNFVNLILPLAACIDAVLTFAGGNRDRRLVLHCGEMTALYWKCEAVRCSVLCANRVTARERRWRLPAN